MGLMDLRKGQNESAMAKVVETEPHVSQFRQGTINYIRSRYFYDLLLAEILLAEGATDEAIAVWEETVPEILTRISQYQAPPAGRL